MRYFVVIFTFLFIAALDAGSLRLYNDTKLELKVYIRGRDGSELGNLIVQPGDTVNWSDTFGQAGYQGKSSIESTQKNKSLTPYTVIWRLSKTDDEYAVCHDVRTGALVSPKDCKRRG